MVKRLRLNFLVFLFALLASVPVKATHIVGGEINYRCLGNDQYEITLQVFRDCLNGVPYFDQPAAIGIFDSDNLLIQNILVQPMGDDTLNLVLDNPCLVIPPEVCYHSTIYQATVTLPVIQGGYQLVYQRCCRNQSIINIVEPLETGATFYNLISEEALLTCNSSAVFNAWPPFYICQNLPFEFNHFATDLDGDSIVYSMCAPFDGASFNEPRPQPPNNPPYDSVIWVNPPYNTDNMLGGVPLSIDQNGFLTALPPTLGQFVVGICAQEYRDGQLISTSRRDFQFNVGVCDLTIVSSFFAPEVVCDDDLSIFFNNQSDGSQNFFWDFGDGEFSTESSPTHTFPDTGQYEISLIAGFGNACADTSVQSVSVQFESLFVDFDFDIQSCEDSLEVQIVDLSVDTLSEIVSWRWDFGNGQDSDQQFPSTIYTQAGIYEISLTVEAANGCLVEQTQSFELLFPLINLADTLFICPEDPPIALNPNAETSLEYTWSPAIGLNDSTLANPLAKPDSTTTYLVSTFIPYLQDTCFLEQEITVVVFPGVNIDLPPDTLVCELGFELEANSNSDNPTYEWSTNPDFSDLLNTNGAPNFTPFLPEDATYYARVTNEFACSDVGSVSIDFRSVQLDINPTPPLCFGDSVSLTAENLEPLDQVVYSWLPPDEILSGQGTSSVLISPLVSTSITLETSNQIGCSRIDTFFIEVAPPVSVDAGPDIISCDEQVLLNAEGENNTGLYDWSLEADFNTLLNSNGNSSILVSPGIATLYYVRTSNALGCESVDTVLVNGYSVNASISEGKEICFPETAELEVTNLDPNDQLEYNWTPTEFILNDPTSALVNVNPENSTIFSVIVNNQFGCLDTLEALVDVSSSVPPLVAFADPENIFAGQSSQLSSTSDPDYSYEWSPAGSLDDPFIQNPIASPDETTTYTVNIIDRFGCVNQAEVLISIKSFICDDPFIFVPNAFTPDNDGLNDQLFVRGNIITDLYFAVYNRWGERVFETESQEIGWDGTFKGQALSPDVFGYYLRARCLNGEEYFQKGNVSLLR